MSTREYEAMFLLDNAAATADFEETAAQVDKILEKHGAEIARKEKWDERRLAYEIKGHRRATYYLVYFCAPPTSLAEMDQDISLNEVILRYLTIALDEPIEEHIKNREEDCEKMAEESRRASLSGWGDRKPRGDRGERDRGDRDRRPDGPAPAVPADAGPADAGPADAGKVEGPKADESKADESKAEEAKAEGPKADESKAEEAKVEGPKADVVVASNESADAKQES